MDFCSEIRKSYILSLAGYVYIAVLWLWCRVDVSEIALSLPAQEPTSRHSGGELHSR